MNWYRTSQVEYAVKDAANAAGYVGPFWHGTNEVKSYEEGGSKGDNSGIVRLHEIQQEVIDDGTFDGPVEQIRDLPSILERVKHPLAPEAREIREKMKGVPSQLKKRPAFTVFNTGEFGMHFGNKNAAEMRGTPFKFYLKFTNLLRLPDLGTWNWQSVIRSAKQAGVNISSQEYDLIFNSRDEEGAARQLIISKGFDGVVYENEAEGRGDSWIVFEPNQIKLADPITYDDKGRAIELKDRFNYSNKDMRY